MRPRERESSTLENVFFGVALVLFLVVGYFAAKRFGVIGGAASSAVNPAPSTPTARPGQPFRVGVDDRVTKQPELKGRDAGPSVVGIPAIKGAKPAKRKHKSSVPTPQ